MRVLALGLVSLVGAVLGWNTASNTHLSKTHNTISHPHANTAHIVFAKEQPSPVLLVPASSTETLVVVPVPAALSEEGRRAQEIARLEARNRRLEALVKVLHTREQVRQ